MSELAPSMPLVSELELAQDVAAGIEGDACIPFAMRLDPARVVEDHARLASALRRNAGAGWIVKSDPSCERATP
jgi:hypothetical protein